MNKCPLLLKYKFRNCWQGNEIGIDSDTGEFKGDWTFYDEPKSQQEWILQCPDSMDYLETPYGNLLYYFSRYEYHAIGDPNPVAVYFNYAYASSFPNKYSGYKLPDDYCRSAVSVHADGHAAEVLEILHEYERQRGNWQTRVTVHIID